MILASYHRENGEVEKAKELDDKTADRARKAQRSFKGGLWFLITAIALSFFFLNWSAIFRIFNCIFSQ
jgi:hypothetical protein